MNTLQKSLSQAIGTFKCTNMQQILFLNIPGIQINDQINKIYNSHTA